MKYKYIDAERLSEKIESIGLFAQKSADYNDGRDDMKMMVLDLIDSLQQEQPEAIVGVVHHALGAHWVVLNQEQLGARLKQFPEGAEVEILIGAKKECRNGKCGQITLGKGYARRNRHRGQENR